MNREIKFRGKLKEKGMKPVFFEGSLIHVTSTYKGEEDEQECNVYQIVNEDGVAFFVEEETIGQYTGLHDKNGKEIYEGDILKSIRWNDIYLVKYIGTAFYLCRKGNNGFNKITTWNNVEKSEIIGNITDNPELLGGEYEC